MPNRVFRDLSTLGTQRHLELNNTKNEKSIKRVTHGIGINPGNQDVVGFEVSEGLRSNNRILNITIENLSAADSTTRDTDIAKEIAILTRKYIFETTSIAMKK